jgi:hypothetical protein
LKRDGDKRKEIGVVFQVEIGPAQVIGFEQDGDLEMEKGGEGGRERKEEEEEERGCGSR